MADRFGAGQRVRTRAADVPHHTRLPRYASGADGTVLGVQGSHPLADDVARSQAADPTTVYTVAFAAAELFGEGEHTVVLDLWEDYLSPVEAEAGAG